MSINTNPNKPILTNNVSSTTSSTGTLTNGNAGILTNSTSPYVWTAGTPTFTPPPALSLTDNPITYDSKNSDRLTYQHEVAAIQVTRNENGEIIKSKMIKTFWVETRSQGSIDYAASKDPAVSEFEPNDIIIKTLRTIIL